MKDKIHPVYHQAKVVCACGNTFSVGSTLEEIHTEICSNCHPFYTGKQNLIDTAGRVERFQAMVKKSATAAGKRASKKTGPKRAPKAERDTEEMLKNLKKELAGQEDAK